MAIKITGLKNSGTHGCVYIQPEERGEAYQAQKAIILEQIKQELELGSIIVGITRNSNSRPAIRAGIYCGEIPGLPTTTIEYLLESKDNCKVYSKTYEARLDTEEVFEIAGHLFAGAK